MELVPFLILLLWMLEDLWLNHICSQDGACCHLAVRLSPGAAHGRGGARSRPRRAGNEPQPSCGALPLILRMWHPIPDNHAVQNLELPINNNSGTGNWELSASIVTFQQGRPVTAQTNRHRSIPTVVTISELPNLVVPDPVLDPDPDPDPRPIMMP
ncbi:uncharacterized protein K444DRAFT_669270 [Hyaloscypha bicolor E]|uniref:Uncharacterized protein n=1 Tax=Hyaloscypha bicolor E TaxID=1095630 RepID=A0A2J6SL48_9HELO|nr:uncharacterized protein K444DRAFT_669270 [Hyaloscypha bicolor E]PMD51477.1 hypothetical protein K444DRAFT_669270 [Hyaloscypha bicolor E]